MKPGWIIGLIMAFIILNVIAGICELTYVTSESVGKLDILLNPEFSIGYIASIFPALWAMFWFDYPFFTGVWGLVRIMFFIPISIGVVVMLFIKAPLATLIGAGVMGVGAGISWLLGG